MSFADLLDTYASLPVHEIAARADDAAVRAVLSKDRLSAEDFITLLSDAADAHLEAMAQKAAALTRRQFGNAILLFTPLYISNYCTNTCAYCSYARHNKIRRGQLTQDQIARECDAIAASGLRHILVLTGEAPSLCSFDYIRESLATVAARFSSVAIEMYPMEEHEYAALVNERIADAMTIYQETYDRDVYASVHTGGPKADYQFRVDAPERACRAGMHAVTIGPLLGLAEWRREALTTVMHLEYLRKKYPGVDLSVSFPRLCPQAGEYDPSHPVNDRAFVRLLCAVRLYLPFIGITLSTRETATMRDGLLKIAVSKISAGVSTAVGGHAEEMTGDTQFEISDGRSVAEISASLAAMDLCPIMVDWNTRAMHGA